ncbi:hypothetical protein GCM10009745_56560 [Kribbella yunnanensis]|uniref:Uncharacterized protein n=1 Tax=Kribbella yunnanensis TaxID=190194 RepID=A0ABN2IBU7_9ACTN
MCAVNPSMPASALALICTNPLSLSPLNARPICGGLAAVATDGTTAIMAKAITNASTRRLIRLPPDPQRPH